MLTLIFGIRASDPLPPPRAWWTTEKAGPDRVKFANYSSHSKMNRGTAFLKSNSFSTWSLSFIPVDAWVISVY